MPIRDEQASSGVLELLKVLVALTCHQIFRTHGVQLTGCQYQATGVSAAALWAHFPEFWVMDEVWGQGLDEEPTREPAGLGG